MTGKAHATDDPVGIMGVRKEITPILQSMDTTKTERTGLGRFHSGTMHGKRVVSVEMGVGKVNAAAVTQSLIDRYHPSHLFFTGSAGGLSPDLDVGDVIIASEVAVHDVGAHRHEDFVPTGFMGLDEGEDQYFAHRMYASSELVDLARRTAEGLDGLQDRRGQPLRVRVGTVVTGDQVILSVKKKDWLSDRFDALAVEMEGAAFAQVASANDVPWLLIRSVSDHADHHFDFAFELWQEYVDDPQTTRARIGRATDRLAYMMRDPQAVLRARRLLDNISYAAGNAARLTEAIVEAL